MSGVRPPSRALGTRPPTHSQTDSLRHARGPGAAPGRHCPPPRPPRHPNHRHTPPWPPWDGRRRGAAAAAARRRAGLRPRDHRRVLRGVLGGLRGRLPAPLARAARAAADPPGARGVGQPADQLRARGGDGGR